MKRKKNVYFKTRKYLLKKIPILRREWVRQFIKANLFGGVGTIINLVVLFTFTEFLGIFYLISGGVGFILGSTANYFINKKWVFREDIKHKVYTKYFKYIIISILALMINLGMLFIFTEFVKIYYLLSQIIAGIFAFSVRFTISKFWIFKNQ